jgi:TRAP-type C4-dicarboxylate transport system permease small subunit
MVMHKLEKLLGRLSDWLLGLAGVTAVLMMVVVSADVLLKFLFAMPINGTLEVTTYYFMPLVALAGIAIQQRDKAHVAVEVLSEYFGRRTNALLDVAIAIVTVCVMALIMWQSAIDAWHFSRDGEYIFVGTFDLPIWPARWIVPAVSLVFVGVSIVQAINRLRHLGGSPDRGRDEP